MHVCILSILLQVKMNVKNGLLVANMSVCTSILPRVLVIFELAHNGLIN